MTDPRWQTVEQLFNRADAYRKLAASKGLRGHSLRARRAYLRAAAADFDHTAIRLREEITGDKEAS